MKYFKYWVKETFQISIDGNPKNICILSGSNTSREDAREEAKSKAINIENRINHRDPKAEYEVIIKEHVHEIIDESNIISICRYGAKILNTMTYTILDLDDCKPGLFDLFGRAKNVSLKNRIIDHFERHVSRFPELGSDFRIYETTKGIRVIGKQYVPPEGRRYTSMMRKLSVDRIYIELSKKQNCYRARITPKPYRIKTETIRIKSPLDCETDTYRHWSEKYDTASQNYSVVRLVKTMGKDFSQDAVIQLHDTICNESRHSRLA